MTERWLNSLRLFCHPLRGLRHVLFVAGAAPADAGLPLPLLYSPFRGLKFRRLRLPDKLQFGEAILGTHVVEGGKSTRFFLFRELEYGIEKSCT